MAKAQAKKAATKTTPYDVAEQLPLLPLITRRLDLARDDPLGASPVHVTRRAHVDHARAFSLEGKSAKVARTHRAFEQVEELDTGTLDDLQSDHGSPWVE